MSQGPFVVSSSLDAVQVYRRGATVVRRATLDEAALSSSVPAEVELVGLPLSLLDPTVKVRGTTVEPPTAIVVAAEVRVELVERMPVSEFEHVRVTLLADKTSGVPTVDDDGFVRWTQTFPPRGRLRLALVYVVAFATGGPRGLPAVCPRSARQALRVAGAPPASRRGRPRRDAPARRRWCRRRRW